MSDAVFGADALARFATIYPERPAALRHDLAGHPLFTLEALVGLAQRMRPEDVEYNRGDLPVGIDAAEVPGNGLDMVETIRSIERNGSWLVLKLVEQDPVYAEMLSATLAELMPIVRPATGEMLKMEGFIFVSSPHAVTPFHFDPEHNILLQLQGKKVMTVFPAGDGRIAPDALHETFHLGGHRNLPYRDDFAQKGEAITLAARDAVYVPVKSPHFVRNGDAVSISFSITWRSEWSYREADARAMNALLRRSGLDPRPPHRFPRDNRIKSVGYRGIAKLRRALAKVRGG